MKPTKKMTEAIIYFPTYSTVTGVRFWFGLVIQASDAFSQTEVMASFRELLWSGKKKVLLGRNAWPTFWRVEASEVNRHAFPRFIVKRESVIFCFENTVIALTKLSQIVGLWKIILARTCLTNDVESRYSPVEGKTLSLVDGLDGVVCSYWDARFSRDLGPSTTWKNFLKLGAREYKELTSF